MPIFAGVALPALALLEATARARGLTERAHMLRLDGVALNHRAIHSRRGALSRPRRREDDVRAASAIDLDALHLTIGTEECAERSFIHSRRQALERHSRLLRVHRHDGRVNICWWATPMDVNYVISEGNDQVTKVCAQTEPPKAKMAPKRKRMGAARRAMEAEAEEKKSGEADGFIAREKSYAEMVECHSEAAGKTSEEPVKDAAYENGEREGVVHGAEKTDGREEKEEELEVKDLKDGTEQSIRQAHVAEEEEPDEEETLVVLELADFKNHPILDDYRSIAIEGIDTAQPTLHIGEYSLHGQMEETVGTHYFYDTKNRADGNAYRYTGQTTKKIKFTIAPPDEF